MTDLPTETSDGSAGRVRHPVTLVLAVVAALAGGTAAASAVHAPRVRTSAERQVEVVGATAVCPDIRQIGTTYSSRVSVGVAPLPPGGTVNPGEVTSTRLVARNLPETLLINHPGQVAGGLGTQLPDDGLAFAATGSMASGLEVEQVVRSTSGASRGLASVRCSPPTRDAWFVGASTGIADHSLMLLANIDDTVATVDITFFGHNGPVDPRPSQGLGIAPHSRLYLDLDQLAPDQDWLVAHVTCRQGRIVPVVRNARILDGAPRGYDYVPIGAPPARTVVVPGIPQGPGFRGLVVGNPGDDDATVSVQATLADSQFVPEGMNAVVVPAHHSVLLTLTSLTDGSPVTATVTSNGPPLVAGTVLYEAQQFQVGHVAELAYGGSAQRLSGPALMTDLVINRPTESTLLLSAPEDAATVTVTPIKVLGQVGGPPAPRTVHVPAGRTVAFRLSTFFPPGAVAELAVQVEVQPGSGPVYATRYLREHGSRSTLSTLLTLQGPAQLVDRPTAVQDDEAGYP